MSHRGGGIWPDLEVIFYRLNDTPELDSSPWADWPTDEREALHTFFHAL